MVIKIVSDIFVPVFMNHLSNSQSNINAIIFQVLIDFSRIHSILQMYEPNFDGARNLQKIDTQPPHLHAEAGVLFSLKMART